MTLLQQERVPDRASGMTGDWCDSEVNAMKRIIFALLFVFAAFFSGTASAEKITIYDSDGSAGAYIDTDDRNTIYLWSGEPVAYLLREGSIPEIYGFNGRHLGWLEKGIVRDLEGLMEGFTKGALSRHTRQEPYRAQRQQKPFRAQPEFPKRRPFYRNSFSGTPLAEFLMEGRN